MSQQTVVITDYDFADVEIEKKILSGFDIELLAYNIKEEKEIIKITSNADAVINQYAAITKSVIDHLPNRCVAIGQYGIGVDTIDVKAATDKGIMVINVPSYCEDEVAEHAFALLFALARKITLYDREVRNYLWDWKTQAPISRICGSTLGLIGFGKIARKLALKASGFSLKIIAYDPYVKDDLMKKYGVTRVDLNRLLEESDFVSIHLPLTDETRHLVTLKELKKMKSNAILINVSRGPIIDQNDLCKALSEGIISAAGLDVFYEEPPSQTHSAKELLNLSNVCATPHVGWYSEQSIIDLRTMIAEDIARVLRGERPHGLVNQEVALRLRKKDN